jgi:hypothetical protein
MRILVGALVAGMFLVGTTGAARATESSGPNFTFGASTSYTYDFNNPKGPTPIANSGSYANLSGLDESFNIDLVQLGISGSRGKASYGAKLDYGDLTPFAGNYSNSDVGLQTAYLSYDMGGAAITAGRYDTPIGYEVLEPWGNANISRSVSWTYLQPVNHDGVFASGHAGVLDGMIGVANDFSVSNQGSSPTDKDDEKAVLGAVGAGISDALNLYFSMIYNRADDVVDQQLYNAIISGKVPLVNDTNFRYALEANYAMGELAQQGTNANSDTWSLVAYTGADFGPTSLDARGEFLHQSNDHGVPNAEVWNFTATAGWYMTEGLQLRLEYRLDNSENEQIYQKRNGLTHHDNILQAQLVWYPEL